MADCVAQLDEFLMLHGRRPHLRELWFWMKRSVIYSVHRECQQYNGAGSVITRLRSVRSVQADMLAHIGPHMRAILLGQIDALQLMLQDDLLYKYYVGDASSLCLKPMF